MEETSEEGVQSVNGGTHEGGPNFDRDYIIVLYGLKLQLHDAIYWLRLYLNLLIYILWLSNSHNNTASIQKNWGDKSHCVIVASLILL